eukprot:SAG31_NODE_6337_length_2059_cov_1.753061_2_plen_125_part_00
MKKVPALLPLLLRAAALVGGCAAVEVHRVQDAASLHAAVLSLEASTASGNAEFGSTATGRVLLLRGGDYELGGTLALPNRTALRAEHGHSVVLRLRATEPHPVVSVRRAPIAAARDILRCSEIY